VSIVSLTSVLLAVEIFARSDDFPVAGCSFADALIAAADPLVASATSVCSIWPLTLFFSVPPWLRG
jgi:hypothetical protein